LCEEYTEQTGLSEQTVFELKTNNSRLSTIKEFMIFFSGKRLIFYELKKSNWFYVEELKNIHENLLSLVNISTCK